MGSVDVKVSSGLLEVSKEKSLLVWVIGKFPFDSCNWSTSPPEAPQWLFSLSSLQDKSSPSPGR